MKHINPIAFHDHELEFLIDVTTDLLEDTLTLWRDGLVDGCRIQESPNIPVAWEPCTKVSLRAADESTLCAIASPLCERLVDELDAIHGRLAEIGADVHGIADLRDEIVVQWRIDVVDVSLAPADAVDATGVLRPAVVIVTVGADVWVEPSARLADYLQAEVHSPKVVG